MLPRFAWLLNSRFRILAPSFRLLTSDSWLLAPSFRLLAPDSRLLLPDPVLFLHKRKQTRFLHASQRRQERHLYDTRMPADLDAAGYGCAVHHLRNAQREKLSSSVEA